MEDFREHPMPQNLLALLEAVIFISVGILLGVIHLACLYGFKSAKQKPKLMPMSFIQIETRIGELRRELALLKSRKGRKILKKINKKLRTECSICLDDRSEVILSPCKHRFCFECVLKNHVEYERTECAVCRGILGDFNLVPLFFVCISYA